MNEEKLGKEEELELTPYQGAYRKELDDPDPETNPAEEEELPQAATSKEESNSFVEQSTKSEQPEHNYKKRYDDLKKHYDAKIEEHKSKEQELLDLAKQASGGGTNYTPPKTPEELTQFKEQYPDVYNVIETVAHSQAENKTKALQDEIKELQGDRVRLTKEKATQELLRIHPDFMDIKADENFITWLQDQPPSIADGVTKNNTDAKWAARVLDLYKADKGISRTLKQQPTKTAADFVPTKRKSEPSKGKKEWSAEEIRRMKPHEFEKYEKEIDLARREGRIR
tara:strand:- start:618 stop:1466 length:849 start_codon:yes stop_codon:yes gene_type:complete